MKVVIINYGAGNLKSITNMLDFLAVGYEISAEPDVILSADKLIFPGQGHFKQAMDALNSKNLAPVIRKAVEQGTEFLGICLGLQILFETSEEAPETKGIGIIKGKVKKFTEGKIPQIGWNKIKTTDCNTYLSDDFFYFVNSYYVKPYDENIVSSYCSYNIDFCASIQKDNLTAVQFHPEKSSEAGLKFFKKWIEKN